MRELAFNLIALCPGAYVHLNRIDLLLRSKRRFEQSGFTPRRSTLDATVTLASRLLSEVHREFSEPLHFAFVDLKAAFDFVDRLALSGKPCEELVFHSIYSI